jgi:hypothetical protein
MVVVDNLTITICDLPFHVVLTPSEIEPDFVTSTHTIILYSNIIRISEYTKLLVKKFLPGAIK